MEITSFLLTDENDEGVYHWLVDPDIDGDGYLNPDDAFPEDGTQWNDTDGDNYGDNPAPATEPDACPNEFGTSYMDVFGCPDADGDGYSDDGDAFDADPISGPTMMVMVIHPISTTHDSQTHTAVSIILMKTQLNGQTPI